MAKHFYALDTGGISPKVVSFDSAGLRDRYVSVEGSHLISLSRTEAVRTSQIAYDYFTGEAQVTLWRKKEETRCQEN